MHFRTCQCIVAKFKNVGICGGEVQREQILSTEKLLRRVELGKYKPSRLSTQIEETIQGTPMYRQPCIAGDNVTISKRRKKVGVVLEEEENAANRPKFVSQHQPRNKRQSNNNSNPITMEENKFEDGLIIDEMDLHKTMWKI